MSGGPPASKGLAVGGKELTDDGGSPLPRPLTRLATRADRWLLAPAPAERLAVFRVILGGYAFVYLLIRLPAFLAAARLTEGFDPVGMLWFLDRPLPAAVMAALAVTTPLLAVLFAAGLWFRLSGPALAVALLTLATYRSSWGRLLYFDNLLVLHVLIVSLAPAADRFVASFKGGLLGGGLAQDPKPDPDTGYGWPLRMCALVTLSTYVLAGVAKLRIGGLDWLGGSSLRSHVAYSAARFEVLGGSPSPIAGPLMDRLWLFTPAATATIVLELGAPLALVPRLRTTWVASIWLMHAAIAATMFVLFPYPLFLVAFAPLYRLERLPVHASRVLRAATGRRSRLRD